MPKVFGLSVSAYFDSVYAFRFLITWSVSWSSVLVGNLFPMFRDRTHNTSSLKGWGVNNIKSFYFRIGEYGRGGKNNQKFHYVICDRSLTLQPSQSLTDPYPRVIALQLPAVAKQKNDRNAIPSFCLKICVDNTWSNIAFILASVQFRETNTFIQVRCSCMCLIIIVIM